jgi:hypothetical protein
MTPARRLLPPAVNAAAEAMAEAWRELADESRANGGNPVMPERALFNLLSFVAVDAAGMARTRPMPHSLPEHYDLLDAKADVQMLLDALQGLTDAVRQQGLQGAFPDAYTAAVCALAAVDPTSRIGV